MSEIDDLKDKLKTATQILRWELADMWGHVSCRTSRGTFLILPLRPPIEEGIPEDDVLEFDLEGNLLGGKRDLPEEIFFFTTGYKARKNVGAMIHCHPPVAVSLVSTGKKIVPIHQHSIKFGSKGVPTSPWLYGTFQEDGERAMKTMGESCALMIKGHGANVVGGSVQEACMNAVHVERTAKMLMWANGVGKPGPMPPAVVKKYALVEAERAKRRGARPPRSPEWNYYERMVKRGERWNVW